MINTPIGKLFYTYLRRKTEKSKEKVIVNADENKSEESTSKSMKISAALVHDIFGHMGEDPMRSTDNYLG